MRIERFWASGYRSLKDIDLTFSGPLDVFYGQNGAGKSNLLRAIRITLDLLSRRMQSTPLCDIRGGLGQRDGGRWVLYDFVRPDDLSRGAPPQIQLGLAIALDSHLTLGGGGLVAIDRLELEVTIGLQSPSVPVCFVSRLRCNDDRQDLGRWLDDPTKNERPASIPEGCSANEVLVALRPLVLELLPRKVFAHVPDVRHVEEGPEEARARDDGDVRAWIHTLLRQGRLEQALFEAKNTGDAAVRKRYLDLQRFLAKHLGRGELDVVRDPLTGALSLVETGRDGADMRLASEGLGLQQVYVLFAHLFLSGARVVAVEEPEAHLHMPTTGRKVRSMLRAVVESRYLDQLLIVTHDAGFALDRDGFFDVSRSENGASTVTWTTDLTAIDRNHVDERGPVVRALIGVLRDMPEDAAALTRRADGSAVTARAMLDLILEQDPAADQYMQQFQEFVVHLTRARATGGSGG